MIDGEVIASWGGVGGDVLGLDAGAARGGLSRRAAQRTATPHGDTGWAWQHASTVPRVDPVDNRVPDDHRRVRLAPDLDAAPGLTERTATHPGARLCKCRVVQPIAVSEALVCEARRIRQVAAGRRPRATRPRSPDERFGVERWRPVVGVNPVEEATAKRGLALTPGF